MEVVNSTARKGQNLLTAIEDAARIAAEFLRQPESVQQVLIEARRLALRSHTNLVILGGEGHGKSTLINSITGLSLVPTSLNEPGTVAPIVVEWGPSSTPIYRVMHHDGAEKVNGNGDSSAHITCDSADAFGTYLLQRFNKDNSKRVRCGVIQIDHDLLRQGLRLIDMPGVAGVSTKVAAESAAFIRGEAYTAVALIRNRGYAPLLRILETLPSDSLRIETVICNRDGDYWDEFADEPSLHRGMAEQRAALAGTLNAEAFKIDPRNVFVLHLPSMKNLKQITRRGTTGQSHAEEVRRFEEWVNNYVRETKVLSRDASVRMTLQVLHQLIAVNAENEQLILGLLEQRSEAMEKAQSIYTDVSSIMRRQWKVAMENSLFKRMKDTYWKEIGVKINDTRTRIASTLKSVRARVRDASDSFSWSDAKEINIEVAKSWNQECQAVREQQKVQIHEYSSTLATTWREIVSIGHRMLPLIPQRVERESGSYQVILQVQEGDAAPHGFWEFVGWEQDKRIANRVLDHYECQIGRVDTTRNGSVAKVIYDGFAGVEQIYGQELESWLLTLRNTVFHPLAAKAELTAALEATGRCAQELRHLAKRLQLVDTSNAKDLIAPDCEMLSPSWDLGKRESTCCPQWLKGSKMETSSSDNSESTCLRADNPDPFDSFN